MERDKNYDLELAGYIWSILKSNLPVLMSWGVEIETVKVITCGLEFRVNGFKHTGKVQIVVLISFHDSLFFRSRFFFVFP